jgi:hypothetical protein
LHAHPFIYGEFDNTAKTGKQVFDALNDQPVKGYPFDPNRNVKVTCTGWVSFLQLDPAPIVGLYELIMTYTDPMSGKPATTDPLRIGMEVTDAPSNGKELTPLTIDPHYPDFKYYYLVTVAEADTYFHCVIRKRQ